MDWSDKSVLVTGGTGSFGKKFIQIMLREFHPARLIVYSRDELKQYEMRENGYDHPSLRYFIGDIRDLPRLERAFNGVDIVIHAAALKQVPACEYNPMEAIKTNILGSSNVIEAALKAGVKKVLALSTDKAVNPVNLYGATKLCAEKLIVSCVRYGNVVGSRGSVVPVFIKQRQNGAITITDERMTRFWISLDQGVRFVIRCVEQMHGGEVFVPKIPSMKVIDLATAVAPEAQVKVVGIRPGEKLHEVLISEDEARVTVDLSDMYVVLPALSFWSQTLRQDWESQGSLLEDSFRYTSNANTEWLSVDAIREIVAPIEVDLGEGRVE